MSLQGLCIEFICQKYSITKSTRNSENADNYGSLFRKRTKMCHVSHISNAQWLKAFQFSDEAVALTQNDGTHPLNDPRTSCA